MSFIVKPCAGGTVFVINFDNLRKLDFQGIIEKTKGSRFKLSVETPEVLLLKSGDIGITLFKSGKIMAKNVKSHEEAEKIAEEFGKVIGAN
ncbi:MAG: hypothetical protein ABIF85_06650 [Nanoarchaeota archaeon]|nr:hypothetical protein [Nanoarchaeota archaeon]MBU4300552.1 hypothetical protein [Nanoarchaeota archaeon]MBU4451328.1 hypothetical protein [Nanoarchaeota archaeon]MCG2723289.1 hypothetical protein [archaeon]